MRKREGEEGNKLVSIISVLTLRTTSKPNCRHLKYRVSKENADSLRTIKVMENPAIVIIIYFIYI